MQQFVQYFACLICVVSFRTTALDVITSLTRKRRLGLVGFCKKSGCLSAGEEQNLVDDVLDEQKLLRDPQEDANAHLFAV